MAAARRAWLITAEAMFFIRELIVARVQGSS